MPKVSSGFTLLAEVEERSQLPAFVVASKHVDSFRERYFERKHKKHNLDGEMPSIHVVPQEKVSGFARITPSLWL